jgi:hypothetical protein
MLVATGADDLPARRTGADKQIVIMPVNGPIRTTLNDAQVPKDQKAGAPSR